jgi:hypothetical protein
MEVTTTAPRAGPMTKAAHEAPSIQELILAMRVSSSLRKGAKDEMAVYTAVPTSPMTKLT